MHVVGPLPAIEPVIAPIPKNLVIAELAIQNIVVVPAK